MKPLITRCAAALLGAVCVQLASAQTFPNKPIRIIVPFVAGGLTDILSRAIGPVITESVGQPVIVETRPGGVGIIGMQACARSAPDGHTICIANPDSLSYHPHLYANLPYNVETDFVPVINLAWSNTAIVASTRMPFNTYKGMIAYAKANPGKLNYATWGPGSLPDVHLQWIKRIAGVDMVGIPYKGSGQSIPAVLSGEADISWMGLGQASPHVKSGKVRYLAATGSNQRTSYAPDLPTLAEEGGDPGLRSYFAVFAPGKTPRPIVDRLNAEISHAIHTPPLRELFKRYTLEHVVNSASEFARFVKADRENAGKVFRGMGMKPSAAPSS